MAMSCNSTWRRAEAELEFGEEEAAIGACTVTMTDRAPQGTIPRSDRPLALAYLSEVAPGISMNALFSGAKLGLASIHERLASPPTATEARSLRRPQVLMIHVRAGS